MICSLLIGSEGRSNTHASVPKAPAVKDHEVDGKVRKEGKVRPKGQ